MKLSEQDKLQIKIRHSTFGRGAAEVLQNLSSSLERVLSSGSLDALYETLAYLKQMKTQIQAIHNMNHEIACLAAKAFLEQRYPELSWERIDVLHQDTNAAGVDLLLDLPPLRIVGEVKTTEPVSPTDFGSQQRVNIVNDLKKLSSDAYKGFSRFMFVTSPMAHNILHLKYQSRFPDVTIQLLTNSVVVIPNLLARTTLPPAENSGIRG